MGLLDFLTSTRRPASGTPVKSAEEVIARLKSLNRPTAPFQVIDGRAEGVDLIAEWRIVDARWYEIFAKAGLLKTFRIQLKVDAATHTVRAKDREYSIEWRAGVPTMKIAASGFKGQKQSIEFGRAYAFTEELRPGEVYNYRFTTTELKTPLQDAVTSSGWTYKGVPFGSL
jgi:hypothetical protein